MVNLARTLFFLFGMLTLLLLALYGVIYLQQLYTQTENLFIHFAVILIFVFTLLIIARYLILMVFSVLQAIRIAAGRGDSAILHDRPKVSILVPCYNEETVIVKALKSLMTQTYPHLEIVVIDDGSTDRTYLMAKIFEFDNGYRSLRVYTKPNGGKSRALNFGIAKATGEYICAVDADSRLEPDAIEKLIPHFTDPRIAAVAGSVKVANRTTLITNLQALEYIEGLNMVKNGQAFFQLVNIIPGPLGLFRKAALLKVGGYQHDTFAEDCDLTLNLLEAGYRVDYEPSAISWTEAPESLLTLIKQRYRWTRGILQAIRKHRRHLWNLRSNPRMSLVIWYMLFESVFWPFMQVWGDLFMIFIAVQSGASSLLFVWWLLFTILDLTGALYCVLVTREDLRLVPYAIIYRLFFINVINIAKIFSTLEEWFGFDMNWGKLERKGNF